MKKKEKENQFVTSRWVRVGETTTCSKLAIKFENKGTQNSLTMNINMHASNFDKEKIKLWHQKKQTKPPINTEKKKKIFSACGNPALFLSTGSFGMQYYKNTQ